ncbi:hypothetical protein NP493_790g01014 [Ridgeia piscesae]|uniref:Kinesin-like protein 6 n=1 Tax=Ridgeia piscesae TaxID=27915 RepID=A0AAD9KN02_RIDPI|nr:hypothetical protein NP493_790g01014 [Ridgeia piscesae]
MEGNNTAILNPENADEGPKSFPFDYSYWSHEDFTERPDGYLEPTSPAYADQQMVFNDLGLGVLDNAWKGYNTSLFAYGQTGSGKSYSMVGYGENKGIVPMVCEELFRVITLKRAEAQQGEEYKVTFSMLEIYNEQVRDLLNPASLKIKGGLKVRESKQNGGFYVEKLTTVPVFSYDMVDSKMNEGIKNRTVASTKMNATSSRAHTIVAVSFSQTSQNAAKKGMTKTSIINLVDLAGSERVSSTGAKGDRLKEGAGINQSLSTLGNCIKALADLSTKVQFRDSVLTKLLKNALGGNSKTIMIAALSPADINYGETLSTLRFASRAKAMKTKAVVNEDLTDTLIRELKEQNARLQEELKSGRLVPGGDPKAVEDMNKQLEEEVRRNKEEMAALEESWQQKMSEREKEFMIEAEATKLKKEQQKTIPHFWNLNEDPSLTAMIIHFTPKGQTTLGSSKAIPPPDVTLAGLSIQLEHALVENDDNNNVTLLPLPGAKVVLNGIEIKEKTELHHNDRVLFGSTNLFVLHHPQDLEKQQNEDEIVPVPSYESAQEEIATNSALWNFTDDVVLQEDLIAMFPMVCEANALAVELKKKCNTFVNRKFAMEDMYHNYQNGDDDWDLPKDEDPFWEDPETLVPVGSIQLLLQPLAHNMDTDENLEMTDYRGTVNGRLQVAITPCSEDGEEIDEFVDKPAELIGKELHFKVKVQNARGLPNKYSSTCCKYTMYMDEKATATNEITGMNPRYEHEKQFDFKPVTKQFIQYLQSENLFVVVWGRQKSGAEIGGSRRQHGHWSPGKSPKLT